MLGKQVVAVSNLEALAAFRTSDARAYVIDARRGEIYASLYDATGRQMVPEVVLPFQRFLTLLPEREIEWISQDPTPIPAHYRVVNAPRALAAAIARIAIRRATLIGACQGPRPSKNSIAGRHQQILNSIKATKPGDDKVGEGKPGIAHRGNTSN